MWPRSHGCARHRTRPGHSTRAARKRGARQRAMIRCGGLQRALQNIADAAVSIDGVEQSFFGGGNRQVKVTLRVGLIDQHPRRAWRQTLLHTDGLGLANGQVAEPALAVEIDARHGARAIVPVHDRAVANHGAAEQLGDGVLFRRRETGDPRRLREFLHEAGACRVRGLPHPAREGQRSVLQKVKKLRHRIGAIPRV